MNKSSKVMITSLLTNAFLVVIKIIFGLIGKSGALIVDAVHSLSDLATDLFSIVGIKLSSKPADKKHPYGHGRLEYLTSIGIGLIIGIVGIYIIYNSVNRKVVIPKTFILYILFFDIIVKLILSRYIIRKGKEYKNNILISSGHESKMDVLSTGIVILSTILVQFDNDILKYADIVASVIIGIFIIRVGYNILKDNISIILDEEETDKTYIDEIKKIILNNNIQEIDSLVMVKIGPYYRLNTELSVDPKMSLLDAHNIIHKIETEIKRYDASIEYISIHLNPHINLNDLNIRKINNDDKDFIIKVQKEIVTDSNNLSQLELKELEEYLNQEFIEYFDSYKIIDNDNEIIGMMCYYLGEDSYNLSSIYLKYKYRGLGIGYDIVKRIINEYNDKDIKLWVYKNNTKAIKFYNSINFKIESETKDRYQMVFKCSK